MKGININEYVYIKLTSKGKDILNGFYENLDMNSVDVKILHPTTSDGYTRFQIWEIAHIFGEYLYLGSTTKVFVDNELAIEEKDIKESKLKLCNNKRSTTR